VEYRFDARGGASTGVVVLSGRLDLLAAPELKTHLQSLVEEGWRHLVVDLDGVPFIDSSGLGALIGGLRAARDAGGDVRIARAPEHVRTILQVCALDRVLVSYPTIEDALAEYR
jgi:anti-anti-sigma factor